MKKFALFIFIFLFSIVIHAEEVMMNLENPKIDRHDMKSIQRGARFFATNCMMCHTLIHLRYNALAKKAGITYDRMPINVKSWPNNTKPPDLSLEANTRSVDWIYTYLHTFYQDAKSPTGFNNLLVPHTMMPDILATYQGQQAIAADLKLARSTFHSDYNWFDLVELQNQGSMQPEQFDETIRDVVNFLQYAAAPYAVEQEKLGYWVIGFMIVLFLFLYYLKKEYWKDIK